MSRPLRSALDGCVCSPSREIRVALPKSLRLRPPRAELPRPRRNPIDPPEGEDRAHGRPLATAWRPVVRSKRAESSGRGSLGERSEEGARRRS